MKNLNQDLNRNTDEDIKRTETEQVGKNNNENAQVNSAIGNSKTRLGEKIIGHECPMSRERHSERFGNKMIHKGGHDHKG